MSERVQLSEGFWLLFNSKMPDSAADELHDVLEKNYQLGFNQGKGIATLDYEVGYKDGYDEGYDTGHSDTSDRYELLLAEEASGSYQDGYNDGYSQGYEAAADDYY